MTAINKNSEWSATASRDSEWAGTTSMGAIAYENVSIADHLGTPLSNANGIPLTDGTLQSFTLFSEGLQSTITTIGVRVF